MNSSNLVGLGDPVLSGKKALFQPSSDQTIQPDREVLATKGENEQKEEKPKEAPPKQVHITTDLTREAMQVVLDQQRRYRLDTGKALPKWKVISDALIYYAKRNPR
jgi:hypothetical protein